ncbi:hypothetical protein CABS01_10355 [Colletotrichum abscissum]|uniref:uncharacterized protein n=1 Tax=Colletotrichum abscissum TaxID=1671311 RepID=UPI0027D57DE1|nr:uncharacterized protein CABS01_10355 [Colletotrichum abscissum]KAK1499957.1 hypothetical protein CABS01_10355 [Colletotrichum abscissum]
MVYLIAMAVCNITTDIALLILPFPTLAVVRLNLKTKIQLAVLFSIGILLIAITIARVPLTLQDSMSQSSRSTWATIEILCSCIVANAPFFYGIIRELQSSVTDASRSGGPVYISRKGLDQKSYELELGPTNSVGNNSSQELVMSP